jgi:hypothetical protein
MNVFSYYVQPFICIELVPTLGSVQINTAISFHDMSFIQLYRLMCNIVATF